VARASVISPFGRPSDQQPDGGTVCKRRFSTNLETEGKQQNPIYQVELGDFGISIIFNTAHMSRRKSLL
jgi:hypothetical protein